MWRICCSEMGSRPEGVHGLRVRRLYRCILLQSGFAFGYAVMNRQSGFAFGFLLSPSLRRTSRRDKSAIRNPQSAISLVRSLRAFVPSSLRASVPPSLRPLPRHPVTPPSPRLRRTSRRTSRRDKSALRTGCPVPSIRNPQSAIRNPPRRGHGVQKRGQDSLPYMAFGWPLTPH
jgi:hypothetical protein